MHPLNGQACLNCHEPLHGAYCSSCGQKRAGRITFRGVVADAFRALTNLDSKFTRTVIGMTRSPGRVVREYVDGRRSSYMNPIKYAFVSTTIFLVVIHLFEIPVWRLARADRESFMKIFSLISYMVFVNVFGPAAVQRIAFWKERRTLAECYVFGLFSYGHLAYYYTTAAALGAYESWRTYLVIVAGAVAFLAWGLVGFYRTRVWRAALAAVFMVPSYYVVGGLLARLVRELLRSS